MSVYCTLRTYTICNLPSIILDFGVEMLFTIIAPSIQLFIQLLYSLICIQGQEEAGTSWSSWSRDFTKETESEQSLEQG